jgi:phosphoglycerate dehydrogenase-like enzyme
VGTPLVGAQPGCRPGGEASYLRLMADARTDEAARRRVALLPDTELTATLREAVWASGCEVVSDVERAEGLIWCSPSPKGLEAVLQAAPGLAWIQLPFAGIEEFVPLLSTDRVWAAAKGIYGPAVAEFALALTLAGLRRVGTFARAHSWKSLEQISLWDAKVTILGGGGIARSLVGLLAPFHCDIVVVRRTNAPIEGARIEQADRLPEALAGAAAVVLALPLTPQTKGSVDGRFLGLMDSHAWLVNVARGGVVVTADLVTALQRGTIGGAALDVTDPEPLPDSHPLWALDNCIIAPHAANTFQLGTQHLVALVKENATRFQRGEPLLGRVDVGAGY